MMYGNDSCKVVFELQLSKISLECVRLSPILFIWYNQFEMMENELMRKNYNSKGSLKFCRGLNIHFGRQIVASSSNSNCFEVSMNLISKRVFDDLEAQKRQASSSSNKNETIKVTLFNFTSTYSNTKTTNLFYPLIMFLTLVGPYNLDIIMHCTLSKQATR